MKNIKKVQLNTEVWKEGNMYVSYVPQLDISSCGKTAEEAKKNIREATELFFKEIKRMKTSKKVFEEAGFLIDKDKTWKAPELISFEKIQLAF